MNDVGQLNVPQDKAYQDLAIGFFHTCALTAEGVVDCWGARDGVMDFGQAMAPGADFKDIGGVSHLHSCGVTKQGKIDCWGRYYGNPQQRNERVEDGGAFESVYVGGNTSCAIERDTSLGFCWGSEESYLSIAPRGQLRAIGVNTHQICVIEDDGKLRCRGGDPWSIPQVEKSGFEQVSVGVSDACGIRENTQAIECWVIRRRGPPLSNLGEPPNGRFQEVDIGLGHACAIDHENNAHCWGNDRFGQSSPPALELQQVSAGALASCGISQDGEIICWGGEEESTEELILDNIPDGRFHHVEVASLHACALDDGGVIHCWGNNDHGQSEPPDGSFLSFDMTHNSRNACAIGIGGELTCWGLGYSGEEKIGDFLRGQSPRF